MAPPPSSFYTPGRRLPHNGSYIYVDHCYVQHYPPHPPPPPPVVATQPSSTPSSSLPSSSQPTASSPKPPIIFVHGGGLTGAIWDSTPDGRPSWARCAAALGYPVYVLDAVDSGRSQRAPDEVRAGAPVEHRTAREVWARFRLGPDTEAAFREKRGFEDGVGQFGLIGGVGGKGGKGEEKVGEERRVEDAGAERRSNAGGEQGRREREMWFENLIRGQSARRRTTDAVEARGIRDAVAMIGKCWVVAHSNGAALTLYAMQMDEDDTEGAEVELEGLSARAGDGNAEGDVEADAHMRRPGERVRMRDLVEKVVLVEPASSLGPSGQVSYPESVKGLVIWGDYLKGHPIWERTLERYMERGTAEHWILPERGIRGNSHFPMCDQNSDVVWKEIYAWLANESVAKGR
ncbi:MAG: hypothetical protein M1821_009505 [Bathelium mastoideum]|nr:MAG: hypothetical protein M1821_009505 [Bathelium mastoideum]